MSRALAVLGTGARVSDYVSLGVIARAFPAGQVQRVLQQTGRNSQRQRELPGHLVVYYVIALALYMQVSCREVLRCLLEGVQWLLGPEKPLRITGKSGISQARTRLGCEPMQRLYEQSVVPVATRATRGAFYRQWKLVSLDGSTLAVPDTQANADAFGRGQSNHGASALPLVRFVSLVENGTHVLFGARPGPFTTGEVSLAREVLPCLQPGMLCLADRYFAGFELLQLALQRGAEVLWRVRVNANLPVQKRLPDGSYLSEVRDSRHRGQNGPRIPVRVIEYQLSGLAEAEPVYRLISSLLDPGQAPAHELAALYHERWEIEGALDELKTHLRGARIVLRSKTPELVRQEFYGLLLAHFAVRSLMHEAAMGQNLDADELSFVHAVRVLRRRLPQMVASPPSAAGCLEAADD
jgi:hypothetical protein